MTTPDGFCQLRNGRRTLVICIEIANDGEADAMLTYRFHDMMRCLMEQPAQETPASGHIKMANGDSITWMSPAPELLSPANWAVTDPESLEKEG